MFLFICICAFALVILGLQVFCVRSCLRVYKLTKSHDLMRKSDACPESWKPFLRPPSASLPPMYMALLRALTTAPFRFIGVLLAVVWTATSSAIVSPKTALRVAQIGGRITAYLLGVRSVQFIGAPASASVAPLVVVNHLCWIDFIVLGGTTRFGFVMSEAVSDAPVIGTGFKRLALLVGSVILNREEQKSREDAKLRIAHRVEELLTKPNDSRLLIFPEGTLSSGEFVVPFKLGAFTTLPPVQPLRLEFTNPHYSLTDLGTMEGSAFFLCLGATDMIFTWGKVVVPIPGDTAASLAERTREELVNGSGIKLSAVGSFRDHKLLFKS